MLISILGPGATQFIQNGADLEHHCPSKNSRFFTLGKARDMYPIDPMEPRLGLRSPIVERNKSVELLLRDKYYEMGVDSRGVERGKCTACDCEEYEGKSEHECGYCGCFPVQHERRHENSAAEEMERAE